MAVRTTQKSGNASDTSVWDGGTAIVDGDSITIAAGHVLTWDMDKSAWVTGVAGVSITGAAGTPGQFTFSTSPGTYVLPIKSGSSISGSSDPANKGQFYIGSVSTPYPSNCYAKIDFIGPTGNFTRNYMDTKVYCSEPTNKWIRTTGSLAISDTTVNVDTDIRSDWKDYDWVAIYSVRPGANTPAERYQLNLASCTNTSVVLRTGMATTRTSGAYVVNVSRNIEITAINTSHTAPVLTGTGHAGDNIQIFKCAFRQTSTTRQGSLAYNVGGLEIGGVVFGFAEVVDYTYNTLLSGVVCGVNYVVGNMANQNAPVLVTGQMIGCNYAIQNSDSAPVFTDTSLFAAGRWVNNGSGPVVWSGKCVGNDGGFAATTQWLRGSIIGGSGNDANTSDLSGRTLYSSVGRGMSFRSATQMAAATYLWVGPGPGFIAVYDVADSGGTPQPGQMLWWCQGGRGASESWVAGTHDPSSNYSGSTPSFVHRSTFESTLSRCYIDVPFVVPVGSTLSLAVRMSKQQNGMTATPSAGIVDTDYQWGHANEYLSQTSMTDNTNIWQVLPLSYTNFGSAPKQVALRVEGKNASGTLFWNYSADISGAKRLLILR